MQSRWLSAHLLAAIFGRLLHLRLLSASSMAGSRQIEPRRQPYQSHRSRLSSGQLIHDLAQKLQQLRLALAQDRIEPAVMGPGVDREVGERRFARLRQLQSDASPVRGGAPPADQ